MISEKKNDEKLLIFHIEQKMEFEKFNCFFIDFLSFGRIKVILSMVERKYAPGIT